MQPSNSPHITRDEYPACTFTWNNLTLAYENQVYRQNVKDMLDLGYRRFTFDLGQLRYINSEALNFLLSMLTAIRGEGGELFLSNIPPQVDHLLVVTRLRSIFNVVDES